ncbi:MAG: universal stress protein [Bacteroidales bacterium]|nr:universal stress protein [Bacteroidales bacterium]
MKQIIVAIDFSKCSVHALEYAINIANKVNSNILMVWVDNTSSSESVFPESHLDFRKEINNNFNELVDKYKDTLINGEISFKIRKGKVHNEIANQAKYVDADLLIAGTHGVSGFEEFWIGSNAYRIVTYAPCPVITIRADYKFKKSISKIILPIDSSLESRQKLPFTSKFAKYFDSEIHVVSLYSTTIKAVRNRVDNYTKQVEQFLEEENIKFNISILEADNITKSTIEYAQNINADLIAVMTEQETTTSNLFLGAYAQQMVNHSSIPVINIHAKEFIRIQSR